MVPAVRKAPAAELAPAAETEEALPVAEETLTVEEAPLLPERARGGKTARLKVDRRARLREVVVRHATSHPARLRALLETVPESARPALLRAIAVSETGYEKALKSLD